MANKKKKDWQIAATPAVQAIMEMMAYCQDNSVSRIFVDRPDIGKTVAALEYKRRYGNVAYLDCSQSKSRLQFIRALARAIGLNGEGRVDKVREEICEHLQHLETPLVILDEVGDLKPDAFLEIKAFWNATERDCAWWLQGAPSLQAKLDKLRERQHIGYAEIFRRFGSAYQRVSPKDNTDYARFFRAQAAKIAGVNAPGADLSELLKQGVHENGVLSLDRLRDNIVKLKNKR